MVYLQNQGFVIEDVQVGCTAFQAVGVGLCWWLSVVRSITGASLYEQLLN